MYLRPRGTRYVNFLTGLHQSMLFDWYLEIGCRSGASFAPVRSKTIAVDPFFRVELNVIGQKPALHVFQATSDDFFAGGFLERNGIRLGASFLDGMHLFEYLLRDFIGTEAASDPKGVIMMHDLVPHDLAMTTRNLKGIRGAWTGDVWKLLPILQRWRPDLTLTMLNLRPTGVLCAANLSPGNTVLQDNYDEIVAEFLDTDLEAYGVEKYFDSFEYTDAVAMMEAGFSMFQGVALDPAAAFVPRKLST
ncbi:MAG: class I SAM-dependent methyltransferase [Rhodobacteraceae bacterium]|nr:class I SAM-dependent methyltransferase [Paracoccaceae bacterium]